MKVEVDMQHLVSLVIRELKNLKGNDRLDITNIKNGEQLAIATAANGGWMRIPNCNGAPTGTPGESGMMVFDYSSDTLYIYNGGWKSVILT